MTKIFDRYTYSEVQEKDLPNEIDLGRYYISSSSGDCSDITYASFHTTKTIRQDLLADHNKSIQDALVAIADDVEKIEKIHNDEKVIPFIRNIKNKLTLNEFENSLIAEVFHIEEIFRNPHSLLEREIEKVHVSKANRSPTKSYQYLASHTEDWAEKSIVRFKPYRILNEELQHNFDVYENQLTIAFVERCLLYLNSRLKEARDLGEFLRLYSTIINSRDDKSGWYKKIERNYELIGAVYTDENYDRMDHERGQRIWKGEEKLSKTEQVLLQLKNRLLLLKKSMLFEVVNQRATQSITLRNTNVLVNHKHYRYIRSLWSELDQINPEESEAQKKEYEQRVITGLRAYAKSIIVYLFQTEFEIFGIEGTYKEFNTPTKVTNISTPTMPSIEFRDCNDGATKDVFELTVGGRSIRIIVLGNKPSSVNNLEAQHKVLEENNVYVFYLNLNESSSGSALQFDRYDRFIPISPLDPDSVERVGKLLNQLILASFIDEIRKHYES